MVRPEDMSSAMSLLITVSGLHGSGKSTQARRLAESIGIRYVSAGCLFRRIAEARGVTLEEMSRLAKVDPEFDRLVDKRTREEAEKGRVVIDGVLSGWMAKEADIRIFLMAPVSARVKRIAKRDGLTVEEARDETLQREEIERERFRRLYEIDISDLSIYDVVLNTELFHPDGTARILKKVIKEYCSGEVT